MKATRLLFGLVCGAACLAMFSGCETQRSACEREKRLTERMDEMQSDLDGRFTGFNGELANLRSNPPVIVQQVPTPAYAAAPAPTPDSISIQDSFPSQRDQLAALAAETRAPVYEPPAPKRGSSAGKGAIRVPVPARTVQAALKEAGFYSGPIDGKVGRGTVDAISRFQKSQGIKADGVVGRVTWQHLQAFVPAGMSTTRLK